MSEDWVDMPFEKAVAYLRGLQPMTDADFADLEAETAARAFTVARVTKIDMLQSILDKLNDGLQKGLTLEEFASDIDTIVGGALTDGHVETIYRTNIQSAYGAGKWQQGTDPDIADDIWGWRYVTVGDDRVRDEHAELDGLEFKTGEGDAIFPPWDFNCRCSAEWITKLEQGDDVPSDELPDDVQAALEDSDFASPALRMEYRPDLTGVNLRIISDYHADSTLVS